MSKLKYFGTDGFRGVANSTLTVSHAYKIGRCLPSLISSAFGESRPSVVIGKDTRLSSDMFYAAVCAGLSASGADVFLAGVISTPGLSFITSSMGFHAGVMITASHNPYTDNGIKIISHTGEKIGEDIEARIEEYIESSYELPLTSGDAIGRIICRGEEIKRYKKLLAGAACEDISGIRIGIDASNGSACSYIREVMDAVGASVKYIGISPDGVNINRGVGSTNIDALRAFVLSEQLDVGFAFDGDADRCIAVDKSAEVIDGDKILYILSKRKRDLGQLNKHTVATTVMSNGGLEKALKNEGITVVRTPVGDKYVARCMKENSLALGGEQSGHIIMSDALFTGDGALTALMLLNEMARSGKSLSELSAEVRFLPQITKSIRADAAAPLDPSRISAAIAEAKATLTPSGRVIVRKSGTEPLLRIMVEDTDESTCQKALSIAESVLIDE